MRRHRNRLRYGGLDDRGRRLKRLGAGHDFLFASSGHCLDRHCLASIEHLERLARSLKLCGELRQHIFRQRWRFLRSHVCRQFPSQRIECLRDVRFRIRIKLQLRPIHHGPQSGQAVNDCALQRGLLLQPFAQRGADLFKSVLQFRRREIDCLPRPIQFSHLARCQ